MMKWEPETKRKNKYWNVNWFTLYFKFWHSKLFWDILQCVKKSLAILEVIYEGFLKRMPTCNSIYSLELNRRHQPIHISFKKDDKWFKLILVRMTFRISYSCISYWISFTKTPEFLWGNIYATKRYCNFMSVK